MGRPRGKLALKFIENKQARKTAYAKRKGCLMKKAHELSVLCGVDACAIIYDGGNESDCPETWPPNRSEVEHIIDRFRQRKSKQDRVSAKKIFGLSDFLRNQKKKTDSQVAKVRLEGLKADNYQVDGFTEEELQSLALILDQKIEMAKDMLEVLEMGSISVPMPSSVWQCDLPPLRDYGQDSCLDDVIYFSTTNQSYGDIAEASGSNSDSCGLELVYMDDDMLTPTLNQCNYGYETNDHYHQHDHGMDFLKQVCNSINDDRYMNEKYEMRPAEQFPALLHWGDQRTVNSSDVFLFSYPSEDMAKASCPGIE